MLPVDPSLRLPTALLLSKGTIQQLPGQWEPFLQLIAVGLQGAPQNRGSCEAGGDGCEQLLPLPPQLQALAGAPAPGPAGLPSGAEQNAASEAGRSQQRSEGEGQGGKQETGGLCHSQQTGPYLCPEASAALGPVTVWG